MLIHLSDHFRIILVPAQWAKWRWLVQVVSFVVAQLHRVVGEKWLLLMPAHEVDQKVAGYIGSVSVMDILAQLAVLPDSRLVVPRSFMPGVQAVLVESHSV